MSGLRVLIVNADDYGLSLAVSRGILAAWRDGIVTSTTFLVNLPASAASAPLLAEAPGLGVGLHLNLTAGRPVLPPRAVPSLVGPDGAFVKSLWHLRYRVRPAEVRREWEAQVDRFLELVGRLPTHLDSHHHVHALPALTAVFVEVARDRGIRAARLIRPDDLPPARSLAGRAMGLLYRRYLAGSARVLARSGLALPDRVLLADFDRRRLVDWLRGLPEGVTELVCHPGYVDGELRRLSGRVEPRPAELADLVSAEVRAAARAAGIRLAHYGQLVSDER